MPRIAAGDRALFWIEERSEFVCLISAYCSLAAVLATERRICHQYRLSDLGGSLPQQFAVGIEILEWTAGFLLLGFLANLACSIICCSRATGSKTRFLIFAGLWIPWSVLAAWVLLCYRPFQ